MGGCRARLLLLALACAAALATATAAPSRRVEVYGFAPGDPPTPPDPRASYDWSVLTTVAWRSDPQTVAAAHAQGASVDLDARAGAAQVVFNGTVADAAKWVAGTVSELLSKGLDGVNFDLENPIDGARDPVLAAGYTGLVAATAAAAKAATFGAARVTVDVPFLPYDGDGRDYDYAGLAAAADALFVMAYDMQALMFGRCVAAANAPLPLVERAVDAWLRLGVPADKLILGLPWYGYTYECIDDDDEEDGGSGNDGNGGNRGNGGNGGDARDLCRIAPVPYAGAPCSDAGGQQLGYAQIMERECSRCASSTGDGRPPAVLLSLTSPPPPRTQPQHATKHTVLASSKNVTPVRLDPLFTSLYFNYRDAPGAPLRQLWFDDPSTLLPKYRVAARKGLRGLGFWNVDLLAYGGEEATELQREQTRAMWDAVRQAVGEWEWGEGPAAKGEAEEQRATATVRRRR